MIWAYELEIKKKEKSVNLPVYYPLCGMLKKTPTVTSITVSSNKHKKTTTEALTATTAAETTALTITVTRVVTA